jgi:bifunctional NMN adenylyltransferase/nudix hydrolase
MPVNGKPSIRDGFVKTNTLGYEEEYDYLVFIGRFQPLHYGHMRVIDIALQLSKKVVLLVGSSNVGRTLRNPFTFQERYAMIATQYDHAIKDGRLIIDSIDDMMYEDDRWIEQVQTKVNSKVGDTKNVGLIGCEKDHTSYYLSLFPNWHNVGVEFKVPLNSTDIRKAVFLQDKLWDDRGFGETQHAKNEFYKFLDKACPPEIAQILHAFMYNPTAEEIREEWKWINEYRAKRQTSNYPVIDITVDACVVQSGHVLVVRRKNYPGKGLLALPGGFLNENEIREKGMLRELREETCIDLSDTVLRANIVKEKVFEDPHRSDRGRLITTAYLIKLQDRPELPKVKGADDAEKAFWLPLSEVKPSIFFEDHGFIIRNLTSGI